MVLCRDKTVKQLTYDHRVSDKNESQRVIDSGGTIFRDRVGGIINITRALGDLEAKKMGVICEPYFESNVLLKEDTHLIIACDGLWDTPNVEKKILELLAEKDPNKISECLVDFALENNCSDNISVLTIIL